MFSTCGLLSTGPPCQVTLGVARSSSISTEGRKVFLDEVVMISPLRGWWLRFALQPPIRKRRRFRPGNAQGSGRRFPTGGKAENIAPVVVETEKSSLR